MTSSKVARRRAIDGSIFASKGKRVLDVNRTGSRHGRAFYL
jgi:hypothetical protein